MDPHAFHERSDTLHTILRAAVAISLGDEQADDLTNYDGDDRTLVIRAPAASRAATDTAARTALAIGCTKFAASQLWRARPPQLPIQIKKKMTWSTVCAKGARVGSRGGFYTFVVLKKSPPAAGVN